MEACFMRYSVFTVALISLIFQVGCNRGKIEGDKAERSYAVGYVLGQQLTKVRDDLDHDLVARGLKDGIQSNAKLSKDVLDRRLNDVQALQQEKEKLSAEDNLKKSQEFMTTVSAKPGAVTLSKGVVVEKNKTGSAATPAVVRDEDEVLLTYVAKRVDGQIVDQSPDTNGVKLRFRELPLPGLKAAIKAMPIGSEWTIYLAPDQAFGAGSRPGIPGQSALIYEIKLLGVNRKK